MRKCINCAKELGKTTKGDNCQQCYRKRKSNPLNGKVNVVDVKEFNESHLDNDSVLGEPIDSNVIEDQHVIDCIKRFMLNERELISQQTELLNDHINSLKGEIKEKNIIIEHQQETINNLCYYKRGRVWLQ